MSYFVGNKTDNSGFPITVKITPKVTSAGYVTSPAPVTFTS